LLRGNANCFLIAEITRHVLAHDAVTARFARKVNGPEGNVEFKRPLLRPSAGEDLDIEPPQFEILAARADIAGTWVERTLRSLRDNLRRNSLAKRWYYQFLTSEDRDSAWAALQLTLSLADDRMLVWKSEVRRSCSDSVRAKARLKYLNLAHSRRELAEKASRNNKPYIRTFASMRITGGALERRRTRAPSPRGSRREEIAQPTH
jgi:hypothetical protein